MMPQGNVGTPTEFYLDKIRRCLLPTKLIQQLGLEFPKSKGNRKYSSVPPPKVGRGFERVMEEEEEKEGEEEEELNGRAGITDDGDTNMYQHFPVRDGRGHLLLDEGEAFKVKSIEEEKEEQEEEKEEEEESGEEDNSTEEWDRHNALHNDVTAQDRCKERLFEEEIELKWEKGGSGLVFYTDAQFWKEHDGENDFDVETADDWDVDMNVYYEKGGGDKDARDSADIRREERLKRGKGDMSGLQTMTKGIGADKIFQTEKQTIPKDKRIGNFEKYTKGFGRKLMEKQGWTDGQGLGTEKNEGIPDALEGDGQAPSNKAGLGFRQEMLGVAGSSVGNGGKFRLQRQFPLSGEEKRAQKRKLFEGVEMEDQYVLPTKYDRPEEVNEKDNVLRSAVPHSNKSFSWKQ